MPSVPARIFVTGGTGFVGSAVIEELIRRGCAVNALARRGARDVPAGADAVTGGLFDDAALDAGLKGCDAAIHLVGVIAEKPSAGVTFERIHVEGTKSVLAAVKRNGIRRYVQMSALGARPNAASRYHQTKYQAEMAVRDAGLDSTIFRPSLIHGPHGEFMQMEARWARGAAPPYLFMPWFGAGLVGRGGAGLLQPVFVRDVARAFADSLAIAKSVGVTYEVGGAERISWPEMHRACAEAIVGKQRPVMPIPAWSAKLVAAITPAAWLPFNRDQVLMSQEDSVCDLQPFAADFGWAPLPFRAALSTYASQL